jgi:alkanesulfonate monooxygenase SsuD/methylene tetrahydromethanopterin reductase-like flavin-dependent oxidoreductase (luciferase family)
VSPPTWSWHRRRPPPGNSPPDTACGYAAFAAAKGRSPSRAPDEARTHAWTDDDRALVADRVDTQFVGTPKQVADHLEQLRDAAGADELVITTITHDHADRVRSYQLLAEEWSGR